MRALYTYGFLEAVSQFLSGGMWRSEIKGGKLNGLWSKQQEFFTSFSLDLELFLASLSPAQLSHFSIPAPQSYPVLSFHGSLQISHQRITISPSLYFA